MGTIIVSLYMSRTIDSERYGALDSQTRHGWSLELLTFSSVWLHNLLIGCGLSDIFRAAIIPPEKNLISLKFQIYPPSPEDSE